jgi:mycothiol system anti-sigma-R factor
MADPIDHPTGHDHDHPVSDCEGALAEIYSYLDGELTDEKRRLIASHLDGCNPCVEAYDFEAELRIVISKRCRDEVPESLRVRIAEKLTLIARGEMVDDGDEGAPRAGA